MPRLYFIISIFLVLALGLNFTGCEKERIVESTEYIHDIKYIESPPDTVFKFDTLLFRDSVISIMYDTIFRTDTVFVNDSSLIFFTDTVSHTDTVIVRITDTLIRRDTVYQVNYVHDTVINNINHYDTTIIVDTVTVNQCLPNWKSAYAAMQYYSDPLVYQDINSQFGISGGYVFYLSVNQIETSSPSTGVYDIYGYIDYWTTGWSGYYGYEFLWRMTYSSGDPADPKNWQISDPPTFSSGMRPGITRLTTPTTEQNPLK